MSILSCNNQCITLMVNGEIWVDWIFLVIYALHKLQLREEMWLDLKKEYVSLIKSPTLNWRI